MVSFHGVCDRDALGRAGAPQGVEVVLYVGPACGEAPDARVAVQDGGVVAPQQASHAGGRQPLRAQQVHGDLAGERDVGGTPARQQRGPREAVVAGHAVDERPGVGVGDARTLVQAEARGAGQVSRRGRAPRGDVAGDGRARPGRPGGPA